MRRLVELAPCRCLRRPGLAGLRVYLDAAQQREVDDHATVIGAKPGGTVPAAPHGQFQPAVSSEIDGVDHIGQPARL